MKTTFAILIAFTLLTGCKTASKVAAGNDLDGQWVLAVFPYQKKTLAEVFGNRVVQLQFEKSSKRISGTTGCNRFTSGYSVSADSLRFSQNFALTKMACPGYDEQLVLQALNRVNRYRLIESQLELMQNGEIVMIFARKLETN